MKGPLREAMLKLNSTDIMDFSMVPFGQAYYDTPDTLCGAGDDSSYVWGAFWDGYNLSQRECFDNKCGAEAPVPRDASCFTGRLHCQHGGAECAVNAIQACSLNLAGFEWRRYLPFVVCMEDSYSNIQAAENYTVINETVKACAQTVTFTTDEVLQCFYTKKSYWLEEMAKRTIPHLTVPYVRVMNNTGEWFRLEIPEEGVVNNVLVQAVCDAWVFNGGDAPKACEVQTVVV